MDPQHQHKLILKIIIGSAWVDGHLGPAEVQYLQTLLDRYQLTHAPDLLALLEEPVPFPKPNFGCSIWQTPLKRSGKGCWQPSVSW